MKKAVFPLLSLIPAVLLVCSCSSVTENDANMEFVDLSGFVRPRTGTIVQRREPKGVLYSGFRILAMPDSNWVVPMQLQTSRKAVWGIGDPKNRLHTTIAEVKISEPLAKEELSHFSIPALKQSMKRSLSRSSKRIQMENFKVWTDERSGNESVEYESESVDAGSRHSKVPLKLFMRGFVVLTPDGRMLSAVVSERTDSPDAAWNRDAAEELLDHIRFPDNNEAKKKAPEEKVLL